MTNATDVYDKHASTFRYVSAYTLHYNGEHVGLVNFKRSRTNGSLQCFLQVFGLTMQHGRAGGHGYDKASAAFYEAATKLLALASKPKLDAGRPHLLHLAQLIARAGKEGNGGSQWFPALRIAGFTVCSAI